MEDVVGFDTKKSLVKQQKCFSHLIDEDIDELTNLFKQVNFKEGDVIVDEGDYVDSVYLIIEGSADVRHERIIDGKLEHKSLATLDAGKAIGLNETGFYSLSGRRTATVVANGPMTTLRLSVAAFNGFALSSHRVKEAMANFAKTAL